MCVLGWFREAGLEKLLAHTFVADFHAPFSNEIKNALYSLITMRWEEEPELSKSDRELFEKLVNPESPDFILNREDYYGFFTYFLFCGCVSEL